MAEDVSVELRGRHLLKLNEASKVASNHWNFGEMFFQILSKTDTPLDQKMWMASKGIDRHCSIWDSGLHFEK